MTSTPYEVRELHSERVDPDRDTAIIHRWLNDQKSKYWDMLDSSADDVHTFLTDNITAAETSMHGLQIGYHEGRPEFMFELYDPLNSDLAAPGTGYSHLRGDIGMHLLVAPTDNPIPGFTGSVMRFIMSTAFFDAAAQRVVVEPDIRNDAVQQLNFSVGFHVIGDYPISDKTARLSYCLKDDFLRITSSNNELVDDDSRH